MEKVCDHGVDELGSIIRDYDLGDSELAYNLLPVETTKSPDSNFGDNLCFYTFFEIINAYNKKL